MPDEHIEISENIEEVAGRFLLYSMHYACAAKELLKNSTPNLFPAIFCLRNSIELLQKSILLGMNMQPNKKCHPLTGINLNKIEDFFQEIENYNGNERVKKVFIKLNKKLRIETPEENFKEFIKMEIAEIKTLSKKYENHSYLKVEFRDIMNEKSRFPEDKKFYDKVCSMSQDEKLELIKDTKLVFDRILYLFMISGSFINFSKSESDLKQLDEFLDSD